MKNNDNKRNEMKIAFLLFMIFNLLNGFVRGILGENPILEFFQGGLVGLGIAEMVMALLPEPVYLKIKQFKKTWRKEN